MQNDAAVAKIWSAYLARKGWHVQIDLSDVVNMTLLRETLTDSAEVQFEADDTTVSDVSHPFNRIATVHQDFAEDKRRMQAQKDREEREAIEIMGANGMFADVLELDVQGFLGLDKQSELPSS